MSRAPKLFRKLRGDHHKTVASERQLEKNPARSMTVAEIEAALGWDDDGGGDDAS